MRKIINGKSYEVPKGFILIQTPMIELIEKGDIALFRDGDQRPVEFVEAMPNDLSEDNPNIIAVKGYEPWTCTDDLKWEIGVESDQDIVGILKCRENKQLMGSVTETQYSVMCCYPNGIPYAFINLNGLEMTDAEHPDVYLYNNVEEAMHLRQRISDAKLRAFEDMLVVEVVKDIHVHPVAVEATPSVPVTPAPCPIQENSVLVLSDGSEVDVLEVKHSAVKDDTHALGVTFKYGDTEETLWYDRDGYTNHPLALHIKRIKLF